MNNTTNVMIVGVGGQGSLLASKLLGHVMLKKGVDVKVSEVHGMSQRGGSVVTYVRFGDKVYSPIIDKGEADYIISFETLEAARYMANLKPGGQVIVNDQRIRITCNMSVLQINDPCRILLGQFRVMRNHDNKAVLGNFLQKIHDLDACFRVQRSGRFIRQQDVRIIDQSTRDRNSLHLAA